MPGTLVVRLVDRGRVLKQLTIFHYKVSMHRGDADRDFCLVGRKTAWGEAGYYPDGDALAENDELGARVTQRTLSILVNSC